MEGEKMFVKFLLAVLGCTAPMIGAPLPWHDRFDEAQKLAVTEKKPLFIYFTGSDWSGWSMKMKKEILESSHLVDRLKDRFIFVELDFPKRKSLPEELVTQNEALKEKFHVHDFPRLILVEPSGKEIARFGYSDENPTRFGDDLIHVLENTEKLNSAISALDTLSSYDLEKYYKLASELQREEEALVLLERGLNQQEVSLFFEIEKYRLLVEQGKGDLEEATKLRNQLLEQDPQNTKGVHTNLALVDFQDRSSKATPGSDPKEVIAPLEGYLNRFGLEDKENNWRLEMMIAQFYLNIDQFQIALEHAERAHQFAPESAKSEIQRSLRYINQIIASK